MTTSTRRRYWAVRGTRLALLVLTAGVYELLTRTKVLDPFSFVPLTEMAQGAAQMMTDGAFLKDSFLPSAAEIAIAFAVGAILGVGCGMMLWRSGRLYRVSQPYLIFYYACPPFALYPLYVSLFGVGAGPVILVGVLYGLPAMAMNTAIGFRQTRRVLVRVGRSMGLSGRRMMWHVYLPAAWPYIRTGLGLTAAYSVIGVIGTEFILSVRGLGHRISFAYNNFAVGDMYALILIVVVLAVVLARAHAVVEARSRRWARL